MITRTTCGVGIDLGTTFCGYSVCQGSATPTRGKFPGEGAQLLSAVHVGAGATPVVGRPARHAAFKNPKDFHCHFKRGIPTQPDKPWNGGPTPVQLTAHLLGHIWLTILQTFPAVQQHLPQQGGARPPDELKVAVTHPASYRLEQQQALLRAADQVGNGFRIDAFYSEPVAGSFWYRQHAQTQLKEGDLLVVLDLGGGTFDISLLAYGHGAFDEKIADRGDSRLGGLNFTGAVFQHLCRNGFADLASCFDPATGLDLTGDSLTDADRRAAGALWEKAEELKLALSTLENATAYWESPHGLRELPLDLPAFLDLCANSPSGNLWKAFDRAVETTLEGTSLRWSDVAHVVLIGGSALSPGLRSRVALLTDRPVEHVYLSSDSEHVVADGASYYALAGERTAQVLPGGLGVRLRQDSGYVYKMFFEPGHIIPATGQTVERLGQYLDAPGGHCRLQLELAEAKAGAVGRQASDGALYLSEDQVVPVHTVQLDAQFPGGRHEARLGFDYYGRQLTYRLSLADQAQTEVLSGSVLNPEGGPPAPSPTNSYAVVFLLDRSGSMAGEKLAAAKSALRMVAAALDKRAVQAALISFGDFTRVDCSLTGDLDQLVSQVETLAANGATPLDAAIALARQQLANDTQSTRLAIVVTDGLPNDAAAAAREAASLKAEGTRLIAVGIGHDAAEQYLRYTLASTPQDYFFAEGARDIARTLATIVELYIA